MVRRVVGASLVAFAGMLLLSSAAWAQQSPSAIAGVIKDASGGALPGVTVEAAIGPRSGMSETIPTRFA